MVRDVHEARPVDLLTRTSGVALDGHEDKAALIILNQPIADLQLLDHLWENTEYRICADGGANRLHDLFEGPNAYLRSTYLPSDVHGDLDSLRDDVRTYYEDQGVTVSEDSDQYSTDFGKAIKKVLAAHRGVRNIAVLGTIAGRLDQGIGLLSEIYREQHSKEHPGLHFWLFSESSISFTLMPGKTVIQTQLSAGMITPNIGILPIYGEAHITTQGLEWDVEDWATSMGGQVSTSNHIVSDEVTVSTDVEVLFTVERCPSHTDKTAQ